MKFPHRSNQQHPMHNYMPTPVPTEFPIHHRQYRAVLYTAQRLTFFIRSAPRNCGLASDHREPLRDTIYTTQVARFLNPVMG